MSAKEKQAAAQRIFVFLRSLTSKRSAKQTESAKARVCECHLQKEEEQTVCEADRERESAGLRVSLCKRKEEQISDKINDQTEVICRE